VAQHSDQERYTLAERIIIDQITHRETLLDRIKALEQELTTTQKSSEPVNRLDTSTFILQIPGMKENYKTHLDFNSVKKYSDLDATEYNTTRPLKPNERSELIEKKFTTMRLVRCEEKKKKGRLSSNF